MTSHLLKLLLIPQVDCLPTYSLQVVVSAPALLKHFLPRIDVANLALPKSESYFHFLENSHLLLV